MPDLFQAVELPAEDQRLIKAYSAIGRPSDDLPYSEDFERMVERLREEGELRSKRELILRLFQLRKAARLPWAVTYSRSIGQFPKADVGLAERLLKAHLSSGGSRDHLPYSDVFGQMLADFNREAVQQLDPHHFWRLLLRVSK